MTRSTELESSLHLFQPPLYRGADGSWHARYGAAARASGARLSWDPATVLSLLSFHYVCGDRTPLCELRRRPWLSRIDEAGEAVHEAIPGHDVRWESPEAIATELGRRLRDEALRVCADRREIYVLLSGGLDSRIVAGTVARLAREGALRARPVALTWGLPDCRDVAYGRRAAEILSLDWQHVELGPEHLRRNVADTATLAGCLVSPRHLHRMTWFEGVSPDALVLAGNYGDMVGRAEFSGKKLLELQPLQPTDPLGLLHPRVRESADRALREELELLRARAPGVPRYARCEHEMHGHYTRGLIAHAMSSVNHFCSVYQLFTDPDVYGYMWSLHPAVRTDAVYARLLEQLDPRLARLPWARTNRALAGRSRGASRELRPAFHAYERWISEELEPEMRDLVDPDWCADTGLFDGAAVRELLRVVRRGPDARQPDGHSPWEMWSWIASLRMLAEQLEKEGHTIRLDSDWVGEPVRGRERRHRVGWSRRWLRSWRPLHRAVSRTRLTWLRRRALRRHPPRREARRDAPTGASRSSP